MRKSDEDQCREKENMKQIQRIESNLRNIRKAETDRR